MLERMAAGEVPRKHHLQLRGPDGALRHEHCVTREGFDGPYTIAYHLNGPHHQRVLELGQPGAPTGFMLPEATQPRALARRHFPSPLLQPPQLEQPGHASPQEARIPLLFNGDVVISVLFPSRPDAHYFVNGDADDLYYIHQGSGLLRSVLGELRFEARDYVLVPKGLLHRLIPDEGVAQHWLSLECPGGVSVPRQWRNEVGQLRMDAPYCHRDFRRVEFKGPQDEGLRSCLVKQGGRFHGFAYPHSPLDVVGWDGSVYPWAFPILNFQPRVGLVHLPPTWHGTFATRNTLICSFVPRVVDFHPEAIPCPYPHSSVDCDEVLFYCAGNFTSRRGVGPGSLSFHPMGVAHGPHPGSYERSIGTTRTDELAVMLDTFKPLEPTRAALEIEAPGYHEGFIPQD